MARSVQPLFGFHLPGFTFPATPDGEIFDRVVDQACAAEAAGFDLVTVMDHFHQIRGVGQEEEPMLEAYTLLGAIAARTSRARLGTLVTGVTYRNPALVAKQVTTLDVISHGRAMLGMGAGWNESEHRGYGFDFPPIGERMDRLDEALHIAKLMFTEERPSFQGRHYRIDGALNNPRPLRPGGPPILVGGSGERRTLRLVARYADYANWGGPLEELRRKTEVLERHCEAEGRDPSTIVRTVFSPVALVAREGEANRAPEGVPAVTPEQAAETLRPYVDAGFGGFIFPNIYLKTPDAIGGAGELIGLMRG
jgi:F420-dependent oxidoreductase-like protein